MRGAKLVTRLDGSAIARRRLANQHLIGKPIGSMVEAVEWFGAVQAQDYHGAKWGLAQRMAPATTEAALDKIFDAGKLIRTHVRPTWHLVTPQDLRWMLDLTAARVQMQCAGRHRDLELDPKTLAKSVRVMTKALSDSNHLTRNELADLLVRAGISPDGQRMPYMLMNAELEQHICSGPRKGKQLTYALLDERVPPTKPRGRVEALALLALRYFRSHGPATAHDFAWWSGLTVKDAREGAALNDDSLIAEEFDDRTYFSATGGPTVRARFRSPTMHLLPNFDEYLVAYRHHDPIYDKASLGPRASFGILRNLLTVDGQIAGAWKRTIRKDDVLIEINPPIRLTPNHRKAIQRAAGNYAAFLSRKSAEVVDLP